MYCTRAKRDKQTLCVKKGHLFGKCCPVTTAKPVIQHVIAHKVLKKACLFTLA